MSETPVIHVKQLSKTSIEFSFLGVSCWGTGGPSDDGFKQYEILGSLHLGGETVLKKAMAEDRELHHIVPVLEGGQALVKLKKVAPGSPVYQCYYAKKVEESV